MSIYMTTMSAYETYRDAARSLTPDVVSQYLATHGWVLETRDDIREIWHLPTTDNPTPDRPAARVMVPLASDYVDFTPRFTDVLYALGCVYDWDAPHLVEQLLAAAGEVWWLDCTPALLASGVDCATTPRRPGHGPHDTGPLVISHQHLVPPPGRCPGESRDKPTTAQEGTS